MLKKIRMTILYLLFIFIGYALGRNARDLNTSNHLLKNFTINEKVKNINSPIKKINTEHKSYKEISSSSSTISLREDDEFDEYEYSLQYEESLNRWNNSIESFFHENSPIDAEAKFASYLDLKANLKKELDQYWQNLEDSTRINDNEYLFNMTYQTELAGMNIKTKYHNKLKRLIGHEAYEKIQEKIKAYKANQVLLAKDGLPIGADINF